MFNKFEYNFSIKSIDSDKHIIKGVASIEELDRDNEIILSKALEKGANEWKKNPVIRYKHTDPIGIGISEECFVNDGKFHVTAKISDKTQTARDAWGLIEDGILKSFSVGGKVNEKEVQFDEKLKKDVTLIKDMELYEISVVDIPSNRNSFFDVIKKSIEGNIEKEDDKRPPKEWFDRCVAHVRESGSASNPEAVCGNLYYNVMGKKELPQTKEDILKEIEEMNVEKKVEKRGNKWCVVHCHGPKAGQSIKCFDSKEEAEDMHRAIQANKDAYMEDMPPKDTLGTMKDMSDEYKNKKEGEQVSEELKDSAIAKEQPKQEADIEKMVSERVESEVKKALDSQPFRKSLMEDLRKPEGMETFKMVKAMAADEYGHDVTYYSPKMVKSGSNGNLEVDERKGMSFKEAYSNIQKFTYTQTGGAGTAGYALIPVYVDPDIIDRTRREIPMVEMLQRRAVQGITYDYNAITALTNAVALAEDAALADLTDTYDRISVTIKYLYSTGRVTGQMIAATKGYIDILNQQVNNRTLGLKRYEDYLIFSGSTSTSAQQFNGFDATITTNATALGGALTVDSMRSEITQCHDAGGIINLIATTKTVEQQLKGRLMDFQRYVDTTQLAWGITTITFDGIPVIVDRYATAGYMYFLDTSVIFMAVLQDAVYEELAKTNDSVKFTIKEYVALIVRAEAFCSILTGIS